MGQKDWEEPNKSILDEGEIEVSLHALTSASNPRVFRITGHHRHIPVEILIDTESHNNFVQEGLLDKLGIACMAAKRFRVYMGNGQYLWCEKMCSKVSLALQGHVFFVDLYVLPIWGLDIVLRMKLLRTLGPCLNDHEAFTMEFTWQDQQVCLQGNKLTTTESISYNRLCSLVHNKHLQAFYALTEVEAVETVDNSGTHEEWDKSFESIPPQGKLLLEQY